MNPFVDLSYENKKATAISSIGILFVIISGFMFYRHYGWEVREMSIRLMSRMMKLKLQNGTAKMGRKMLLEVNDGVEDCADGSDEWANKMIGKIFLSCCIICHVLILTIIGYLWANGGSFGF